MVSMKMEDNTYAEPNTNKYGYGLCISLTEDQAEALGLKDSTPAAGSTVGLRAIAQVMAVTQQVSTDGDNDGVDVTLRFQITDLEVTQGATGSNAQAANRLYANNND